MPIKGKQQAPKVRSHNSGTTTDHRISVCNICNKGIFNYHAYVWSSTRFLTGYVHKECKGCDETQEVT